MKDTFKSREENAPRHAIILAAGLGTRLRPLTYTLPKPLMPLWGRPMLEHNIRQIARWGVTDVLINLHYSAEKIINELRLCQISEIRLNYSFEPEILGTGGALRKAQWFIEGRDPFWLLNSDIAFDLNPLPLRRALSADKKNLAALWLVPQRGPRTVEYKAGRVIDFNCNKTVKDRATFSGLHLLRPGILDYLPGSGAASIITAYEKAMRQGCRIAATTVNKSFWADIGSIDDYLDAHARIREAAKTGAPGKNLYNAQYEIKTKSNKNSVDNGWAAGTKTVITKNSRIERCVFVGDNCAGKCYLRNTILAKGVKAASDMDGAVIHLRDYPSGHFIAWALRKTGWKPEDTYINPLPLRGSDRTYLRLANGSASVILCTYGSMRPENMRIFKHTAMLAAHGIRIPRILFRNARIKAYLQEDCGIISLGDCVGTHTQQRLLQNPALPYGSAQPRPPDVAKGVEFIMEGEPVVSRDKVLQKTKRLAEYYYRPVIDMLIKLHSIPVAGNRQRFEPAFDAALFRWEHDLFVNMFLKQHTDIRTGPLRLLRCELSILTESLCNFPRVMVHRDMQSTNVLWHQGEPVFIDFQGMRPGPAAYDLASLLCDPYMMLDEILQDRLLDYYNLKAPCPVSRQHFWAATIQRLTQALGAFGRLAAAPGTKRFAAHIPPAISMLQRAISQSSMQLTALSDVLQHGRSL